ncbi:hypothetical protein D3C81_2129380 [compost metagenome]
MQHLDVVGQAIDDEQVGQLGTQLVVGLCFLALAGLGEDLGLLHRVGREKRRVVAVLAQGQRDEPGFGQLILLAVGN